MVVTGIQQSKGEANGICEGAGSVNQSFRYCRMAEIKLPNGLTTLIDDEDLERLSSFKWYGCKKRSGIYACYLERTALHRMLLNAGPGEYVDHINGNTLDNRKANLRICTNQENSRNQHNKRKGTTSKYKGVYWNKQRQKWHVELTVDGKKKYIGCFDSEQNAAIAYNAAAEIYYGEFARPNKIGGE